MRLTSKNDIMMRQKNEIRPCEECGRPIDPAHRCERCKDGHWCGRHNSPYKSAKARFCDKSCRDKAGDRRRGELKS
jgi:hypothetical protein